MAVEVVSEESLKKIQDATVVISNKLIKKEGK